jgi:hypothetical protein
VSFQLSNANRDVQITYTGWLGMIRLAEEFGWKPAGTVADVENPQLGHDPDLRDGPYASNDGLLVTDDDARAFAAALRLASCRPGADRARISRIAEVAEEGRFRIW